MKPKIRRRIIFALASVAITLLALEGLLRVFDPLGIYYFRDLADLEMHYTPGVNYRLPEGRYEVTYFTVNMTHNGRLVPDTQPSDCQIVAVGDSLTFGHGVNDHETWVNLLARMFPEVEFINAGMNGYNSEQARLSMDLYPDADGFLWVIVSNDVEETVPKSTEPPARYIVSMPMLSQHLMLFYTMSKSDGNTSGLLEVEMTRFWEDVEYMISQDNVAVFASFDYLKNLLLEHGYDVPEVHYNENISFSDGHPTPSGHRMMANQMRESVEQFIGEVCE